MQPEDAADEPVCGKMFGPATEAPRFCTLEPEHDGDCKDEFVDDTDDAAGADLPSETDETPSESAESASGAEDAPGTAENEDAAARIAEARRIADANPIEDEEIVQTAPIFAAEMVLTSSGWWLQRLPNGGRQLKIVPLQPTAQGPRPVLPAYVLEFPTAKDWDAFRSLIERDGAPVERKPQIVTAAHLPPGMKL